MNWTELLYAVLLTATMLPLGFFFSCSSCCGCTLWDDTFSVDLIATDYTVVSGTWSIASGNLNTTSTNALIVSNTTLGTSSGVVRAQVTYSVMANGDTMRFYGNYKDANNCLVGEIIKGATTGTLKLYSRIGGVETEIASQAGLSLSLIVDYCLSWSPTIAMLTTGDVPSSAYARALYTPISDGYQGGMGSGATVTGTVRFQRFIIARHPDESSACTDCRPCTPCSDLEPDEVSVEITGVTNGSCATCANYNTTWVLPNVGGCTYRYDDHNVCFAGFGDDMTYRLQRPSSGDATHRLFTKDFDSGNVTLGATTVECESRVESLPTFANGSTPSCTVTGMSATITYSP